MQKTLYIHIGAHKTGTSAIQRFLSTNREILKGNGYLYPGHDIAHHDMAEEFRTLSLPQIINNPKRATHTYFDEIDNSNLNKFIVSSEVFERSGHFVDHLKNFLMNKYQVKIIFYIRRQDDKIESIYNASVKNPQARSDIPFSEFISNQSEISQHGRFCLSRCCKKFGELDYYSVLHPWSQAFGKENIIVRCYEKEQLPKDIFHDFLGTVGLNLDTRYRIPEEKVNMSLNWDLIDIIRICNTRFRDDLRFHQFLVNSLAEINRDYKEEKQRLLPPRQRRDIITQYEESNAKVAREYLGRTDGRLFYAPLPDPDEPWTPYEGLTVEKIVPVLTQMMFNLEKKHQQRMRALASRSLKQRILIKLKRLGIQLQ
jgi:hypothetical protein